MTSQIHVLRGCADDTGLAWAYFEVTGDSVQVTALTGASSYIDRRMTCDEARAEYKRLIALGWIARPLEIAQEHMPIRRLKIFIYN